MAELRYVDWDGLVYYDGKIKEHIRNEAEEYLKMGGIVSFENLPAPSWTNLNYIYKITDEFTSTDEWFELSNRTYSEGTWVQVHDFEEVYKYIIFDEKTIGGTADIDLSDYYTKAEVDAKLDDVSSDVKIKVGDEEYTADNGVIDLSTLAPEKVILQFVVGNMGVTRYGEVIISDWVPTSEEKIFEIVSAYAQLGKVLDAVTNSYQQLTTEFHIKDVPTNCLLDSTNIEEGWGSIWTYPIVSIPTHYKMVKWLIRSTDGSDVERMWKDVTNYVHMVEDAIGGLNSYYAAYDIDWNRGTLEYLISVTL